MKQEKRCPDCSNYHSGTCWFGEIMQRFCIANGKFHFHPRKKEDPPGCSYKIIRGLCLKEPWAGMVASGKKTIETRTWKTKYRGLLLVCASKKPPSDLAGHAFAVVDLKDCRPMTPADEEAAGGVKADPGRYAWEIEKLLDLEPFPIKGRLGLFKLNGMEEARLMVKMIAAANKRRKNSESA